MKQFLLVDDHEIVRMGLKNVILALFQPCNIYEAFDEKSALHQLSERSFDIVIMDVQMPDTNAVALMESISKTYPGIKVLIFSMSQEKIYAKRFLLAGAKGFISKDAGLPELKKAIDQVLNNRKYISVSMGEHLTNDPGLTNINNPFDKLSSREFEIATLLINGESLGEIAKALGLGVSTVSTYKARLFEKLGIKNIMELFETSKLNRLS